MSPRLHAMRLINMLERSNYVSIRALSPYRPSEALPILRAAKMALYSEAAGIWVPDVGTYDWIVETKRKLFATTGDAKP